MDIKIYIKDLPGDLLDNMSQGIASYIKEAAMIARINPDNIKNIGVASSETYRYAIQELLPGERYTDNNEHVGVGKTSTCQINGTPAHTIIFNIYVFNQILEGMEFGIDISEWPAKNQVGPYIIAHELGHCKFHEICYKINEKLNDKGIDIVDIDTCNQHYFNVLFHEIGACFYGDRFRSRGLFEYLYEQDKESFHSLLLQLEHAKNKEIINDVALIANNISWLYLVQYSKLMIGKLDTPFESDLISAYYDYNELESVNLSIDESIKLLINSNFINLKNFSDSILAIRTDILNHLNVSLIKNEIGWGCFW